jgi:hypothetical protein
MSLWVCIGIVREIGGACNGQPSCRHIMLIDRACTHGAPGDRVRIWSGAQGLKSQVFGVIS